MSQTSHIPLPKLLRLLYVHNPFYLISACLFVYGLKAFLRPDNMDFLFEAGSVAYIDPWWLMGSLCGVTLLMAITAFLIVHLGKVWEDARSLVLVLLLMFLAISVSFDEIIALVSFRQGNSYQALSLMAFGGAFSIAVIECLLRGLKIRLSAAYRFPFYALLALFFAFPMCVCPQISSATPEQARWRIALFPTLAALISLSLIPAIRRGSKHVRDNGTPWSWPWFPWTVFVFLAGAVVFRSYSLAISFDRADARADFWDSSFGLYFLVPFALSIIVVLLEVAIVEQIENLRDKLIKLAPLTLLLAYPWFGPWTKHATYSRFAFEFIENASSPAYIALLLLLVFYAVAWWRQIRYAELGVICSLAALVFIGPRSFGATSPTQIHAWPLALLGAIELCHGIARRHSLPTTIGALALSFCIGIILADTPLQDWKAPVAYHLVILSTLATCILYTDNFALWLRKMVGWMLLLSGAYSLAYVTARTMTPQIFAYSTFMGLTAIVAWYRIPSPRFLIAAALNFGSSVLFAAIHIVDKLWQLTIPPGVKPLLWAFGCFAMGVTISMLKSGFRPRIIKQYESHPTD